MIAPASDRRAAARGRGHAGARRSPPSLRGRGHRHELPVLDRPRRLIAPGSSSASERTGHSPPELRSETAHEPHRRDDLRARQPRRRRLRRVQPGGRPDRPTACRNGRWRWAISSSHARSSARASIALRARGVDHVLAVPGMLFAAGHVKNDVPSVLNAYAAEHGLRLADGPRSRHRRQAAGGRARPDRRGPGAWRERCRPGRDLPARGRPRHLRQRRQRQRRQGRPHAVGGHRLRPCRDRLFGRGPPAHRGGARARRAPGLPAHRRLSLLPVHRHPGAPDLRGRRRRSRHAIRRSTSSMRTISTTTRW